MSIGEDARNNWFAAYGQLAVRAAKQIVQLEERIAQLEAALIQIKSESLSDSDDQWYYRKDYSAQARAELEELGILTKLQNGAK